MKHNSIKKTQALIVDDEPDIRELLVITLNRMDINVTTAADINNARQQLQQSNFDFCLTDMKLPDGNGIELVEYIQKNLSMPVAVITAHGNVESAVRALKAGAFDFVAKPIDLGVLRNLVNAAIKVPAKPKDHTESNSPLIGNTAIMEKLRATIEKLARSQAPIHIFGDSGTGKELIANEIHRLGARSQQPFIAVNCGALPDELMESELFGHLKGSFSGAVNDHLGLIRSADGGSLFLDEIAELPIYMQVKLLRAIQEKKVRPVGSNVEHSIDVRILSASNKDLKAMVENGTFRNDLYYRINVIQIDAPNLQQRKEDISLLADHILNQNKTNHNTLSKEAKRALSHYSFPGNVRELENILQRATTLCEAEEIQASDLQLSSMASETDTANGSSNNAGNNLLSKVSQMEKDNIVLALENNHWNRSAAARELGMTLRQLRYRLDKLDIN